jgi:uncharacterized protein YhjY with autotransporter beta-barrel domain
MTKTMFLSTALSASLALYAPVAQAQEVLGKAPDRPAPIIPDETFDGIGSADPETDIIIGEGTLVIATAGPSTFFPTFEVGAILEADGGSIQVTNGAQVTAPTDFSFSLVSLAADNSIDVAGDVISDGAVGGAILLTFATANTVNIAESGVVFTSGFQSPGIGGFGSGHRINIDGLVQSQGVQASGILVGGGTDIAVNVGPAGQVIVEGDFSPALSTLISPFESDISFTNAGLAQSFGNVGSGVVLATPGATLDNTGTIASVGDGGNGVFAAQNNTTITNSGKIIALGDTFDATIEEFLGLVSPGEGTTPASLPGTAILIGNGGVDLTNSGVIKSRRGPAILTSAEFADFLNGSGFGASDRSLPITIFNEKDAVIAGRGVAIQGSDLIEQVDNAGLIIGDVSLAGGDDSFTQTLSSGRVLGKIDGGEGTDTLTLSGRGVFHGSKQTGFEKLTLTGEGRQVLFGDFGTFEELLVTSGNSLTLNRSLDIDITGSANFEVGAMLKGSGAFSGDVISAGTILPGRINAVGQISIGGDFTQTSDGTLVVDVRPRFGRQSADLLSISGTANLDGTLLVLPRSTRRLSFGDQFPIIEAGEITGAFGDVITQSSSPVLYFEQIVDENTVSIEVRARSIGELLGPDSALASLGSTLDALRFGGDYANFAGLFGIVDGAGFEQFGATLIGLAPTSGFIQSQTADNFARRFTSQISQRTLTLRAAGEAAAGFSSFGAVGLTQAGALAQEAGTLGFFGSVSGSFLSPSTERAAGHQAFEEAAFREAGELTVGADLKLSDSMNVGLAVSNVRESAATGLGGDQSSNSKSTSAAAYASVGFGKGFADIYAGFSEQSFGLAGSEAGLADDRLRTAAGVANGDQTVAGARVGLAFSPVDGMTVGPVASLDYVRSDLEGYQQTLGSATTLNVHDRTLTSIGAKLGMIGAVDVQLGRTGRLSAFGSIAYTHELGDDEDMVTANFAGADGLPFSISRQLPSSWVAMDAGAELHLSNHLSTKLSVSTNMGRGELSNHQGQATLSWRF